MRLKLLAGIMFISGVFGLVNTAGTVLMAGAILAVAVAVGLYAIAVTTQPSQLLVRGVIGLAVLRVLVTVAATLAIQGTETSAMIAGVVFPALLLAYTIVQLRELSRETTTHA
jgi:hypothetical protein